MYWSIYKLILSINMTLRLWYIFKFTPVCFQIMNISQDGWYIHVLMYQKLYQSYITLPENCTKVKNFFLKSDLSFTFLFTKLSQCTLCILTSSTTWPRVVQKPSLGGKILKNGHISEDSDMNYKNIEAMT